MLSWEWCLSLPLVISSNIWPAIEIAFNCFSLCAQPPNSRPAVSFSGEGEFESTSKMFFLLWCPIVLWYIYIFLATYLDTAVILSGRSYSDGEIVFSVWYTCTHAYTHQRRTSPLDPLADQCIALAFHALWFYWMYSVIFSCVMFVCIK